MSRTCAPYAGGVDRTSKERWVAIASAPQDQSSGRVTLHAWDGAHDLGEALASVELPRPSWLTWGADRRHLHVACESASGEVVTLRTDLAPDGVPSLTCEGRVSTGGANPCHLALLPDGLTLVAANYADGTVSAVAVRDGIVAELTDTVRLTGSGPHQTRQDRSHAHQIVPLSADRVAVVDLGADEIVTYAVRQGALHRLASSAMPPGSGPRHFVRDPRTGRGWLATELSGSLIALREKRSQEFEVLGEVPATTSQTENFVAQIWLSPDAQRLLISNRGPDTVSLFDVTPVVPVLLDEVIVPAHPRHFHAEDVTLLVAGRDADAVTTHDLSSDRVGRAVTTLTVPAPMCVAPRPTTDGGE